MATAHSCPNCTHTPGDVRDTLGGFVPEDAGIYPPGAGEHDDKVYFVPNEIIGTANALAAFIGFASADVIPDGAQNPVAAFEDRTLAVQHFRLVDGGGKPGEHALSERLAQLVFEFVHSKPGETFSDDLSVHAYLVPNMRPAIGAYTPPVPFGPGGLQAPSTDPRTVKVAVVDTGIIPDGYRTAALDGMVGTAIIVEPGLEDPIDADSDGVLDYEGACHGTFIAGHIARHTNYEVHLYQALEPGTTHMTDATVAAQLQAIKDTGGYEAVVMSWGSFKGGGDYPIATELLCRALAEEVDGPLLVAAAGNDGNTTPWYPAALHLFYPDRVASVGVWDPTGNPTPVPWSNHGPWVAAYADGTNIESDFADGVTDANAAAFAGGASWTGTSFAVPTALAWLATRPGNTLVDKWAGVTGGGVNPGLYIP